MVVAVDKAVAKRVSGFALSGGYFFRLPIRLIAGGFVVEKPPTATYVTTFHLPLYEDWPTRHLAFSTRFLVGDNLSVTNSIDLIVEAVKSVEEEVDAYLLPKTFFERYRTNPSRVPSVIRAIGSSALLSNLPDLCLDFFRRAAASSTNEAFTDETANWIALIEQGQLEDLKDFIHAKVPLSAKQLDIPDS